MATNPLYDATGAAPKKLSKGQLIAGILADALAGAAGQAPRFAPMMEQRRRDEQEEANWGRRLEESERIKAQYRQPDVAPMERDVAAWLRMTPQQQEAFKAMRAITNPEPDVAVTLPNGQFYAGPRSGLAVAIAGAGQTPAKPVGKLTPINGGQTAPPSGGFRY